MVVPYVKILYDFRLKRFPTLVYNRIDRGIDASVTKATS